MRHASSVADGDDSMSNEFAALLKMSASKTWAEPRINAATNNALEKRFMRDPFLDRTRGAE
jgi:hypothetical protein